MTDEKIALKVKHTYHVAELCEQIARSEGMSEDDISLAWLSGMLHDIGRFEQIRRYGTFSDANSIDHAQFGADLLFSEGLILNFPYPDESWTPILEQAIRCHSMYRIPDTICGRNLIFCQILRDADKIDILRVQVETPVEKIYDVTSEELQTSEISPQVMNSISEKHATLRSLKKTPVDHIAGHISLVFELVFSESWHIVEKQGYLEKLLSFSSQNETTNKQFQTIREIIKTAIPQDD